MRLLSRVALVVLSGGSVLGLLFSIAILVSAATGCSCNWQTIRLLWGLPILFSSLAALAGSVIYLRFQAAGGLVTLIGAFLASPIPIMVYTNNWALLSLLTLVVVTNSSVSFSTGALFFLPWMVTSPILLLAGILEIPGFRKTIVTLARKLSAKYYAFLES